MKKYKLLSIACALTMCLNITGCSTTQDNTGSQSSGEKEKTTLTVFAAASMTETLQKIADNYKENNKNVDIVFNFDSSGTLKTQIEQGADCDIFISAAEKQMNQLDIKAGDEKNPDKLDFIDSDSRVDLLENKVVLIVPENSNKNMKLNIASFEDVKNASLVALGNSDVPVGQYSQQIFENLGLWDELNNSKKISFASNVKEVVSQVATGAVDCGVVYQTDVTKDSNVNIVDYAPEGSCDPAIYPAAVTKNSKNASEAQKFLDFLSDDTSKKIFSDAGFTPLT